MGIHLKGYLPFYLEPREEASGYLSDGCTLQYAALSNNTKLINSRLY